ncbi:hypothetical protein BS47DRAFT_136357 [Hydnum rufescens UP504]|uniref:Uncharacterized protein n=1 Tax=Hydnum rufescens UP504 TaxID=1448309 RepID=A0A9P6AQB3_9AGAM|nr:hypothetical protein BS47DRAFT_136357 [Hydnum rufescens UP504]
MRSFIVAFCALLVNSIVVAAQFANIFEMFGQQQQHQQQQRATTTGSFSIHVGISS